MDYNNYYQKQIDDGGLTGYYGRRYQKGYGIGSIFKQLYRWVVPIIKEHALPVLYKTVDSIKSDVADGIEDLHEDLMKKDSDASIKESVNKRINETIDKIKKKIKIASGLKKIKKIKKNNKNKRRKQNSKLNNKKHKINKTIFD